MALNNKLAIGYEKVLREYVKDFHSCRSIGENEDVTQYVFRNGDLNVCLLVDCINNSAMIDDDDWNIEFIFCVRDLRFEICT